MFRLLSKFIYSFIYHATKHKSNVILVAFDIWLFSTLFYFLKLWSTPGSISLSSFSAALMNALFLIEKSDELSEIFWIHTPNFLISYSCWHPLERASCGILYTIYLLFSFSFLFCSLVLMGKLCFVPFKVFLCRYFWVELPTNI